MFCLCFALHELQLRNYKQEIKYLAFILLLLLLPKEKFNNKESKIKFNISIISIFIMMMLTFALPIASGSYVADPRGGDTNVTEQIKLIISQPISFVRVFYENAIKSGTVKFLGEGGLTSYAYYGNINDKNIYIYIIILLCASIFIENGTKTKELKVSYKIFILSLILCITCMIWGSMYLIFTPVSGTIINGVQNRYFIPLIFPLLFLVNNNKIKNNFDELKKYIFYCLSLTWINIYSIIITLL